MWAKLANTENDPALLRQFQVVKHFGQVGSFKWLAHVKIHAGINEILLFTFFGVSGNSNYH